MCYRYVVNEGIDSAEIQVLMSCSICGGCRIKRLGLQASTGRVHGMTSCDPGSPCVQLVARTIFGQRGAKVSCHFPSRERKFHVIFV